MFFCTVSFYTSSLKVNQYGRGTVALRRCLNSVYRRKPTAAAWLIPRRWCIHLIWHAIRRAMYMGMEALDIPNKESGPRKTIQRTFVALGSAADSALD